MPRLRPDIQEDGRIILLSVVPDKPSGAFQELRDDNGNEYENWMTRHINIFGIRDEHKRQIIGEHPELLEQYVKLDTSVEIEGEAYSGYSLVNCVGSVEIAEGIEYPVTSFVEFVAVA